MKEKNHLEEFVAQPDIINTYQVVNTQHPTRQFRNIEAKVILVMQANF